MRPGALMVPRTLLGCSPFVACGLISAFTQWRVGTVIALALSLVLTVLALRGDGVHGAVLEISSTVFCGATAVLAYTDPALGIRVFVGALATGWLALTAWGSIAVRRPFTRGIDPCRLDAVRHPAFHRAHLVATAIWATGFTATAAVLAVLESAAPHSGLAELVIQLAGTLAPAVLVQRYQAGRGDGAPGRPAEDTAH